MNKRGQSKRSKCFQVRPWKSIPTSSNRWPASMRMKNSISSMRFVFNLIVKWMTVSREWWRSRMSEQLSSTMNGNKSRTLNHLTSSIRKSSVSTSIIEQVSPRRDSLFGSILSIVEPVFVRYENPFSSHGRFSHCLFASCPYWGTSLVVFALIRKRLQQIADQSLGFGKWASAMLWKCLSSIAAISVACSGSSWELSHVFNVFWYYF